MKMFSCVFLSYEWHCDGATNWVRFR